MYKVVVVVVVDMVHSMFVLDGNEVVYGGYIKSQYPKAQSPKGKTLTPNTVYMTMTDWRESVCGTHTTGVLEVT